MNDTQSFGQQLRSLIVHSSGRHLDITDRLQELAIRVGDMDTAQERVLEMLTPVAPPIPQPIHLDGVAPPLSPAPYFPPAQPWDIHHPVQDGIPRPNFAYPPEEQGDLPRVAQAIHRERTQGRG